MLHTSTIDLDARFAPLYVVRLPKGKSMDMEAQRGTLYDRLGGDDAVQAAVVDFYARVMEDPLLEPFFRGFDITALVKKQVSFMIMAFGGPHEYTGRDLRVAHGPLVARGLSDAHFDRVAFHLSATLAALGVAPDVVSEVLDVVETTRGAVLGREPS